MFNFRLSLLYMTLMLNADVVNVSATDDAAAHDDDAADDSGLHTERSD